jgi:hypothetical protein
MHDLGDNFDTNLFTTYYDELLAPYEEQADCSDNESRRKTEDKMTEKREVVTEERGPASLLTNYKICSRS